MRIGIDFDNTIAKYDRLFAALAVERGLLASAPEGGKTAVRDAVRALPDGDEEWQRLQAEAYGRRMGDADLSAGFSRFVARCRAKELPLFIVSHKSARSHIEPTGPGLRAAALGWMEGKAFFDPGYFGFDREAVYFEDTRAMKISRIRSLHCTHFIDDLVEVFAEPDFPRDVSGFLLTSRDEDADDPANVVRCKCWNDIALQLLEHSAGYAA